MKAIKSIVIIFFTLNIVVVTGESYAEPRAGKKVYESKCAMCHATGAANSPKFSDGKAWAPRIAKGRDTLYAHAMTGFNAMPAKGLCSDCTDIEIKAAVDYMVDYSR